MSEWKNFVSVSRGPRSGAIVLFITFVLTVFIDLTVAIEIGMILAAFLFISDMTTHTQFQSINTPEDENSEDSDPLAVTKFSIPKPVEVFEINGPLFFGAAYKFRDAISQIDKKPKVFILRMRNVPYIDSTGLRTLKEVLIEMQKKGTKIVLSGITREKVIEELQQSRIIFLVGKANIKPAFPEALERAKEILEQE